MLATLALLCLLQVSSAPVPEAGAEVEVENLRQLLKVKKVYVDRLGGGETASQIRDMIIASLLAAKLFLLTENQEKADAILRGSAEDLIFTDTFQTSDGIDARASVGGTMSYNSSRGSTSTRNPALNVSVGQSESERIAERKHEATASVRLVTKEGDIVWSTTQESLGGKFRGASADVADKIARQLKADYERAQILAKVKSAQEQK